LFVNTGTSKCYHRLCLRDFAASWDNLGREGILQNQWHFVMCPRYQNSWGSLL